MSRHPAPLHVTGPSVLLVALWLFPAAVQAHDDLHERIAQLSAQIAGQPGNARLFLQRADLRRQHGEYAGALADLADAARLKPDAGVILLAKARVFSDAGQTTNALQAADELLAVETNCAEGHVLRARCRVKLNQAKGAVEDYTAALNQIPSPEPDLYLERAHVQAALGQLSNASKGLDEGMARLGNIPALELPAIEFDRQRADFDAALTRVDVLMTNTSLKETWLVLRGEVLAQASRLEEAKLALEQALAGIDNYPSAKRGLAQTLQLQTRAKDALTHIEARHRRQLDE